MDFKQKKRPQSLNNNSVRGEKTVGRHCKSPENESFLSCIKKIRIPTSMNNAPFLKHPDLTMGQKRYLCSIAKVYSTKNMKTILDQQMQLKRRTALRTAQLIYENSKKLQSGRRVHSLRSQMNHAESEDISIAGTEDNISMAESEANIPIAGSEANISIVRSEDTIPIVGSEANISIAGSSANISIARSEENIPISGSETNSSIAGSETNSSIAGSEVNSSISGSEANSSIGGSEANISIGGSEANISIAGSEDNIPIAGSEDTISIAGSEDNISIAGSEDNIPNAGSEVNSSKTEEASSVEDLQQDALTTTTIEEATNRSIESSVNDSD